MFLLWLVSWLHSTDITSLRDGCVCCVIRFLPTSRPYGTMVVWVCVLLPTSRPSGTMVVCACVLLPTSRPSGTMVVWYALFYLHYVPPGRLCMLCHSISTYITSLYGTMVVMSCVLLHDLCFYVPLGTLCW